MNYLVHALPFLERPYFAAATGVPDWLTVIDRKVRVRRKHVEPFFADGDPILAAVAAGVAQHLSDDARFHGTRAFFEVSGQIADLSRDSLNDSPSPSYLSQEEKKDAKEDPPVRADSLRTNFLGHLLCEVLLDAALAAEEPNRLVNYYEMLDGVDAMSIEWAVNRMAPRPIDRLALFFGEFRRARILWDYLEDCKLMIRMNQVMLRVGLPGLPKSFATILPEARRIVANRKEELLDGIPTQ